MKRIPQSSLIRKTALCSVLLLQIIINPPFSLFRDYLVTLIENDKKFLIIGSQNNITYKEIFPLLMNNKMWLGYNNGDMSFKVPDYYEPRETRFWIDENGQKWRSLGNIAWFTNLDIKKRHEELILIRKYNPENYPSYENLSTAINIDKVIDIPCDYKDIMGVPITFMDKYSPDQFEIVGCADANVLPKGWLGAPKHFIEEYYSQGNTGQYKEGNRLACYFTSDNKAKIPYKRILVRNKHPEE